MPPPEVIRLARRCAWCGRLATRDGWEQPSGDAGDAARETSTICPECADSLRALGLGR